MNSIRKKVILLGGLLLMATALSAGTVRARGTAGATELLLPTGAKGLALGGSYLGTVSGVDAMFYNPAGVAGMSSSSEAQFSQMQYIADITVNYVAVVSNLGAIGNVGFSLKTLDFGEIPVTTATETAGTGQTYSPKYATFTTTLAKSFSDRVRFGANLKYVSESIMQTSASGIALDMGIQYASQSNNVHIGVAMRNLGPKMKYAGSDLEHRMQPVGTNPGTPLESFSVLAQGFELPSNIEISATYVMAGSLNLHGSFINDGFSNNQARFAAEFQLGSMGWVAGGMNMSLVDDTDDFENEEDYNLFGITFGGGLNVPVGNLNIGLEYGYRQVNDFFNDNQSFSVKIGF